jgi:hypothetical protein
MQGFEGVAVLSAHPQPNRARLTASVRRYQPSVQEGISMKKRKSKNEVDLSPLPAELSEKHFPGGFTVRDEANALTAFAFRNGPLEDLHVGQSSPLLDNPSLSRITNAGSI